MRARGIRDYCTTEDKNFSCISVADTMFRPHEMAGT